MNKLFNFPSNPQVNVAPFGTPEGISIPNNLKNNDTDLLIVEKRINDSLKPLFLISNLLTTEKSDFNIELLNHLIESTIVLVINSQATLGRVRRNNVAKEIYGSEVILPIKIKDTPKMFDETETERVRKLAKSIRKNNEARQSLLKQNYNSKGSSKKTSNSSGNNSTGNSSNSKSSSGSNGGSNNFNGSPSNVASGNNNTKSASVLDLKRLNSYIVNQSFKMEGIKNLPSMLKKGYYMVKLDIKKAYLHVLVDPQFRDLFRFVWKGVHYRWKTMPFGLSTAPRIFTMLSRPVLRMLRDTKISVIAYLDDLLIVAPTKEECLTNLKKTMDLLLKLGFKLNLEKSILEPTQSITFLGLEIDSLSMKLLVPKEKKKNLDQCSPRKLAGLKGKLIALKDAIIPFRLYTRQTNKFHIQCLTLANGDWDQSFPVPQEVKSEISIWLTVLNQWNGKEISLFPNFDYVLTTDASESGAGATLKKGNTIIKTWSPQWSSDQSTMSSNRREMLALLLAYQAMWSNSRFIDSLRTTLETMSQEEDHSNWRTHSRFLQCESRSPQSSLRNESQNDQKDQELQLATEERSIQSHPTSIRSSSNGLIRITPEPSDDQLLDHKDECPPTRLESMETMPSVSTTNTTTFGIGEDDFLKFDAYVDITDIPDLEISNVVSNDSSSGSSSPNSPISPRTGYIPGSTNKEVDRINSNSNSTTLEAGDYSTSNPIYAKFYSFCTSNNLDPSDITLVVFMDYLAYLFKVVPSLAYSTINGHRSMLNQLLHLYNKSDIVNDPFIARLMAGIHKLRPASAKYNEIWDANLVFKYLSKINVLPKFTYSALLHKTLVLCKMFGLARSSDLVKWSLNNLIISADSIKGPVINSKEQRNNNNNSNLSILELTSLDDDNSSVCPVRHLKSLLLAASKRRSTNSGNSVFIQNNGDPLSTKEINEIVVSTLSKSGIDISHSTRSAMASLLLSNNIPFHVVKKMGRWKLNDTVDTFYDKKIIGEKSSGFLNTVVKLS
ncbi:hypothetical protein ACTA71_009029 [Dictyostelium dimigraforme]